MPVPDEERCHCWIISTGKRCGLRSTSRETNRAGQQLDNRFCGTHQPHLKRTNGKWRCRYQLTPEEQANLQKQKDKFNILNERSAAAAAGIPFPVAPRPAVNQAERDKERRRKKAEDALLKAVETARSLGGAGSSITVEVIEQIRRSGDPPEVQLLAYEIARIKSVIGADNLRVGKLQKNVERLGKHLKNLETRYANAKKTNAFGRRRFYYL